MRHIQVWTTCQAGAQSNHLLDGGEEGGATELPAAQRGREPARPVDPFACVLAGEQEQIRPRPCGKYRPRWNGAEGVQRARFEASVTVTPRNRSR